MSARGPIDLDAPTWRGDPALIVYALRYALSRATVPSPAPLLVLRSVQANREDLPTKAQRIIVKDVSQWLDGPGSELAPEHREPWVLVLAALGVRHRPARTVNT